jgi:hypothetical protein
MDVYIDASRMPVACRHFQDEEFEGEDWGKANAKYKAHRVLTYLGLASVVHRANTPASKAHTHKAAS